MYQKYCHLCKKGPRPTIRPLLLDFLEGLPQKRRYVGIRIGGVSPSKTYLHIPIGILRKVHNNLSASRLWNSISKTFYFILNSKAKIRMFDYEVSLLLRK